MNDDLLEIINIAAITAAFLFISACASKPIEKIDITVEAPSEATKTELEYQLQDSKYWNTVDRNNTARARIVARVHCTKHVSIWDPYRMNKVCAQWLTLVDALTSKNLVIVKDTDEREIQELLNWENALSKLYEKYQEKIDE